MQALEFLYYNCTPLVHKVIIWYLVGKGCAGIVNVCFYTLRYFDICLEEENLQLQTLSGRIHLKVVGM